MSPPVRGLVVQGVGPTLVLVHGTAGGRSSFGTLPWYLRDRLRVAGYDRRGTGAWSIGDDEAAPPVETHARDLEDVVRSTGDAPVVVFGTSFGATVALEMLRARTPRVAGAILHEPAILETAGVDAESSPVAREFLRLSAAGREREAVERFLARLDPQAAGNPATKDGRARGRGGAPEWRAVHRDLAAAVAWRPRLDEFVAIDMPVLLLESERSAPARRASVESLARILPGARRESIAGASHVLSGDETWRRVAAIVAPFVAWCVGA